MRKTAWLIVVLMMSMPRLILSEEPVYFADPNLQAAVEKQLSISWPTPADMLYLTDLKVNKEGIIDLTGLECAANLMELELNNNKINDISAVSGLANLTYLSLWKNQISDISVLSGLPNLTYLNLSSNQQIRNVSAISGLTNLTRLGLGYNQITDISALSGLKKLATLSLRGNQVNDISALAGLTNLEYLGLLNNPLNTPTYYIYLPVISSFNPKLTNLTYDSSPNLLTDDWGVELPNLIEFINHFGMTECGVQNNWCNYTDLDQSGSVDVNDFAKLLEYYFECTE